jgi:hypothetical protein
MGREYRTLLDPGALAAVTREVASRAVVVVFWGVVRNFVELGARQRAGSVAPSCWRGVGRAMAVFGSHSSGMIQGGRQITADEVEQIRATVELFSGLARKELAHTVCEHLGWRAATGQNKVTACLSLLERLEGLGLITLPPKCPARGGVRSGRPALTERTAAGGEVVGDLAAVGRVWLEIPAPGGEEELWNEYVDRYHYLGYRKPFGCPLRYFVESARGVLGCVLLAGAAKAITVRDEWIGWAPEQRLRNLPWVVSNSRFLIFPWVKVRHLASHVLGKVGRRVVSDWQRRWGYGPMLLETFVDPERFRGTSYEAAGWLKLGLTTGRGLVRAGRSYTTTPKLVFVRPLHRDFRAKLCSEELEGGVSE